MTSTRSVPEHLRPTDLLSAAARRTTTSAVRDLLEHARRPGVLSLAGGLPDPDGFPAGRIAGIAHDRVTTTPGDVLQYGLTAGSVAFRQVIADRHPGRSIDEILVTTGSQQAIHLLAQVLLDPGDTVIVGDPDYLGALQAFRASGARLDPVTVDRDGLDVDEIADRIAAGSPPKLVYAVPHFHNPTGSTLTDDRHAALLALALEHRFLVVLDDPYRDLGGSGGPARPPVHHPNVVHLGSTSKILAPGLRVGWMIGPRWLLTAVERAKQSADLHTSELCQAIVADALTAPWFNDHVESVRAANTVRRDALITALAGTFADRVAVDRPAGGMFAWVRFVDGTDTTAFLTTALDHGVAFVPGSAFAVERDLRHHARLSWATNEPAVLRDAVDRLDRAHRAHTATAGSRQPSSSSKASTTH
ncbi:MAG: PLP-dependent aminotransferase family protein [Acidimicrobiales bacterium]